MKKHGGVGANPQVFNVRPAPGWMDVTEAEIRAVVASPLHRYKFQPTIERLKGAVRVGNCDWRQGLELTLRLTTAHDIDWVIADAPVSHWDRVHKVMAGIPWDEILPVERPVARVTAKASGGFTSSSANLREALVKASAVLPTDDDAAFRLKVDLRGTRLQVTASLGGDPLYQRGYKADLIAAAPLPEHHAAACARYVMSTSVTVESSPIDHVYVPFAGSGTMGFEALLTIAGGGPGSFARRFACDSFPATPTTTMEFMRRKLVERLSSIANPPRVTFVEINGDAATTLRANVKRFGHENHMTVVAGDVFKIAAPTFKGSGRVLMLLNPPYGQRLAKASDVPAMYRRLGAFARDLTRRHPDRLAGGCVCPDEDCWRAFTREIREFETATHHFTHGGEDVRLVRWTSAPTDEPINHR